MRDAVRPGGPKKGISMALFDDGLKGWGGVLLGFGAAMVGTKLGPATGETLRPIAKALVKGALVVSDRARELAAEAGEQLGDLVAEVRAEAATAPAPGAKESRAGAARR